MIKLYDILKEVKKIPDEYIRKIAKQYDNKPVSDFYNDHKSLFAIIQNRGKEYFDDVTKNMIRKTKNWTDEEIEREAKKYNHKKDFEEGSPKAFAAAKNRGPIIVDPNTGKKTNTLAFYKKVTAHMTPLGNIKKRIIYVHEFTDENNKPVAAYVGLTYDSQLRYKQHTTGTNKLGKLRDTQVTKFIRENPTLKHTYKELTGFLETDEAVKQEQFWEDKYKDDGWLILGKKRAGSLGNTYTVKDSDLKDFVDAQAKKGLNQTELRKKYPNQVNLIYHRGLHKPPYNYLEKFERTITPNYTDESAFEKAMTYNSNGEIMNNDPKLYGVLSKRKLLAKVRQAFEERDKTSIKVDEAKVVPNKMDSSIPVTFYESFNNEFYKNLVGHIEDQAYYGFGNNKEVSTFLFNENDINPIIIEYLKKRILQSEVEILRNGEVELVDSSNIDTLSEDELLEYLNEDKEAQQIISKLFWKYYFKYLDIQKIKKECFDYTLKKAIGSSGADDTNDFFKHYYPYFDTPRLNAHVYNNIVKYFEDYDTILYPEDILDSDFENYLSNSLLVQDIDEAKVVPARMDKPIKIPSGWSEHDVDDEPDEEGNIEIESYSAPMEGWDYNHEDSVAIWKNPQGKYFISVYISFGEWGEDEEIYNSLYDAKKHAVEIMNDLKNDWKDEDNLDEAKVVPAKRYYAIFNRLGEYNDGIPFYTITNTKEEMVNKLNKIYLKLTGEKEVPYSIEDLEDEIYMGKKLNHFISDDWADVTDNEQVFTNDISYLKTTPTRIN